jgi:hypothetical protein
MMHRILLTAAACTLLTLCSGARADDCDACPQANSDKPACALKAAWLKISDRGPLAKAIGDQRCCAKCATTPCCCPDDYCPKPEPCVRCVPRSCCPDDYCPKPQPCVPCVPRSCCPDTYCPKPAPNLCIPLNRDFQRCGGCGCDSAAGNTGSKRPG